MILNIRGNSLNLSKGPHLMGIVNVTPDSFSDGGRLESPEKIISLVAEMIDSGASIIDIGGESTRPFAEPVSEEVELSRVIPAIKSIRQNYQIPISIDTTKANVARKAVEAGADIINDISALRFDQEMIDVVKYYDTPLIIMHMQGSPGDMQINPSYEDIIADTINFFEERISWLQKNGITKSKIIIDPGIGFGKTLEHNLTILNKVDEYQVLGCPVLIGHSRKSFIGKILDQDVSHRDQPTSVISGILANKNVNIIRVHDVRTNSNAIKIARAICSQTN